MGDARHSNVVVCACWLTLGSFLLIIISFSTPNWLENDSILADATFVKLGLWTVCFNNYVDPKHHYDFTFDGCRWVLDEEYQIIDYIIRPPFFVAVQFFFTLCLMTSVCAAGLTTVYVLSTSDQYDFILLKLCSFLHVVSGSCGLISTITFGALGDSRSWMPDYLHNNLSWSFALGVTGSLLSLFASVLFWIEARRVRRHSSTHQQKPKQFTGVFPSSSQV